MASEWNAPAERLLEQVLARYGSVDGFLACLHSDPRELTSVLPVIGPNGPRVRLRDPASDGSRARR